MERKDTQLRYTDQELLDMLEICLFDYGRMPSQRIILGDSRFPTHHTYRARFGSVSNAVKQIIAGEIGDNMAQHEVLGSILKRVGAEILDSDVILGGIMVDYKYTYMGKTYYVDLMGVDGTLDILERNMRRRQEIAERALLRGKGHYIQIMEAVDIINELESGEGNE